jgi:hypothetical protein
MRRRDFIQYFGGAVAASLPIPAKAQQLADEVIE